MLGAHYPKDILSKTIIPEAQGTRSESLTLMLRAETLRMKPILAWLRGPRKRSPCHARV